MFDNINSDQVTYSYDDRGINFYTKAEYRVAAPTCKGNAPDFEILAAVNFGLRGYKLDPTQCVYEEVGQHNTAYHSVAYDRFSGRVAFSIPGQDKIEIYDHKFNLEKVINGYQATTLEFHSKNLWFVAAKNNEWDRASLYQLSMTDNSIQKFLDEEIADSRGLTFSDKFIAISDGFNGRVILLDINTKEKAIILTGLHYPNGISFSKDNHLYIVEEHNNVIRKFNIADWSEVWRSPKFQLQSPSSTYEIESGMYQGKLLIAEADGNRIFIVEPKTWKILYEINHLRSVLKAIPVYS